MNILFGCWRFDGEVVTPAISARLAASTARYGPDGQSMHLSGPLLLGSQLYQTGPRSMQNAEPCIDAGGNICSFAGRLDNGDELRALLGMAPEGTTDASLALSVFQRWGAGGFSILTGEWSLAIWSTRERSLYLAVDHARTNSLFYCVGPGAAYWATYLDSILAVVDPALNLDYAARYLTCRTLENTTPYVGIFEVPAGSYLRITDSTCQLSSYWSAFVEERLRYRHDGEYEQHFLSLFHQAVARRIVPGDPVVAELSGGMDSSSIVCMADYDARSRFGPGAPLVDTLSYVDDSEPNWNETPYIHALERYLGKEGIHLPTSYLTRDLSLPNSSYLFPGIDGTATAWEETRDRALGDRRRVVISGIGGDELLGGPSNPLPELCDAFHGGKWSAFWNGAQSWCIAERVTLFSLISEVAYHLLLPDWRRKNSALPNWLTAAAHQGNWKVQGLEDLARGKRILPSSHETFHAWHVLLETLPHRMPHALVRREYRYPILDKDLVEFLLRVPPEQLRRPGQRRSLMRRSLRSLLPPEILARTRKASLQHGPVRLLQERRTTVLALIAGSLVAQLGFVDPKRLRALFENPNWETLARQRKHLMRLVHLEIWLRSREQRQAHGLAIQGSDGPAMTAMTELPEIQKQ